MTERNISSMKSRKPFHGLFPRTERGGEEGEKGGKCKTSLVRESQQRIGPLTCEVLEEIPSGCRIVEPDFDRLIAEVKGSPHRIG